MPSCSKSCFRSEIGGRDIVQEQAAAIERLRAALKPFADAVFNDNGDMTIDHAHVGIDAFTNAYFAMKPRDEQDTGQ